MATERETFQLAYQSYENSWRALAKAHQNDRDGVAHAALQIGFWEASQARMEKELAKRLMWYQEVFFECPECGFAGETFLECGHMDGAERTCFDCGTLLKYEVDAEGPMWRGESVVTVDHSHWVRVR